MKKSEVLLVLFVLFLIAAFIEFSYGSAYFGAAFATASMAVLLKLSRRLPPAELKKSVPRLLTGAAVVGAVLYYNLSTGSEIKTLDSFLLMLGASLILLGSGFSRVKELGYFSFYLSLVFLALFSVVYLLPGLFNIKLPYYYGHYFITLPVAKVLTAAGLDLRVTEMNLLYVEGMTNSLVGLDLACYGFYSMFLIISATVAYGITMDVPLRRVAPVLLVLVFASYMANFLRVSTLIALAYYYGIEAMLLVHSYLGWVFFGLVLLPLMYLLLK